MKDVLHGLVFLLHLLVMAPTLIGLSGVNKCGHQLEDLGGPARVLTLQEGLVGLNEGQIEDLLVVVPPADV